jgi:curved DNA-binding protein CbpA
MGMGGLFLHTTSPPAANSVIELIFDLKSGEVRARAIVRHSAPGKGMGVQFIQMRPEDRARLSQFLSRYVAAGVAPVGTAAGTPPIMPLEGPASEKPPQAPEFERELQALLELAQRGTYYQLLGISPDSSGKQVKQKFYALAREYHPDRHMARRESLESLKKLMAAMTEAYKTLMDEQKRAAYDKRLAASGAFHIHRVKTESGETIKTCFVRATECLRAKNFVGSIVWLRKCVDLAPDHANYRALLARSLAAVAGYRNEAVEHFEKAIELDPLNTTVYVQLAELYEEMQLPSRARSLYAKILEIDPAHQKAWDQLARLEAEDMAPKSMPFTFRVPGPK